MDSCGASARVGFAALFDDQHWLPGYAGALNGRCLHLSGNAAEARPELEAGLSTLRDKRLDGDVYLAEAENWLSDLD